MISEDTAKVVIQLFEDLIQANPEYEPLTSAYIIIKDILGIETAKDNILQKAYEDCEKLKVANIVKRNVGESYIIKVWCPICGTYSKVPSNIHTCSGCGSTLIAVEE